MGKKKTLSRRDLLKTGGAMTVAVASASLLPAKAEAAGKSARLAMVIDLDKCYGCKACAIACKAEFNTRLGVFRSQVIDYENGKYPSTKGDMLPWLCNHCENPPCVAVCPVDPVDAVFKGTKFKKRATYKRPDGVVLVDADRCIGCGQCIINCPYNVRSFDPGKKAGGNPDEKAAQKCTFCEHRVKAGVVPSCVNTCPGRARIFGDLNDKNSEASKLLKKHRAEVLLQDKGTKPQVYYIGKNRKRINNALKKGEDLRREANSKYQLKVWKQGPYA